jgi:hypothetical protein
VTDYAARARERVEEMRSRGASESYDAALDLALRHARAEGAAQRSAELSAGTVDTYLYRAAKADEATLRAIEEEIDAAI